MVGSQEMTCVPTSSSPAPRCVQVHDLHLAQTGVTKALAAALRELCKQRLLPANPAHFLATVLAAFYDRAPVWQLPGALVLREADAGGCKVHSAVSRLCTLGQFSGAWGLPHVMRCLNLRGVQAVRSVLLHNLHDSFFR